MQQMRALRPAAEQSSGAKDAWLRSLSSRRTFDRGTNGKPPNGAREGKHEFKPQILKNQPRSEPGYRCSQDGWHLAREPTRSEVHRCCADRAEDPRRGERECGHCQHSGKGR